MSKEDIENLIKQLNKWFLKNGIRIL
jgi:hypothetical protein